MKIFRAIGEFTRQCNCTCKLAEIRKKYFKRTLGGDSQSAIPDGSLICFGCGLMEAISSFPGFF